MNTQNYEIDNKKEENYYENKYLKYKIKYNNLKKYFLQTGGFDYPWPEPRKSNLLYIALVISPDSDAGMEIDVRTKATIKQSAFGNMGGNNLLRAPHLSLLQINVPQDDFKVRDIQPLHYYISSNIGTVLNMIKLSFLSIFNNTSIHSEAGHYNQLGSFIARVYDDKANGLYNNVKQLQTTFRETIERFLFQQLGPYDQINIQTNLSPQWSDSKSTKPPALHTHYSGKGNNFPHSAMSINVYSTTNWEPHISLFRIPSLQNSATLIKGFIDNQRGGNMSYINLWHHGTTLNGRAGSLSHIFVSFYGVNFWIPLL
jgi:hypothetical protein